MNLFSRKSFITKTKRPLYAASRVFNVSSTTASTTIAKYWVHGTARTANLVRKVKNGTTTGLRKAAYATSQRYNQEGGNPGTSGTSRTSRALHFYKRVAEAWTQTPTKWYPLPLAVGALLLVAIQYRRKSKQASKEVHVDGDGMEVVKLKGPWQVHVLGALPLRNMSRLWGYMNSLELPVWFRPFGFKLYAFAFGCNLEEIEPADLKAYASLGDFFYRKLRDGARPVDKAVLVSPADGKVLHFGVIQDLRVEQVKGMTYSLDALLGLERPGTPVMEARSLIDMPVVDDHEFANVNGIEYSLDQLIGSSTPGSATPTYETDPAPSPDLPHPKKHGQQVDASVVEPDRNMQATLAHDTSVALELGIQSSLDRRRSTSGKAVKPGNALYFTVIYLAPGDYHRFHSPTAWVVEKRRHFVGELFSVSPYMAKRLENLFVLNERVALLGRWRYGFFGMVPVGATNVGSIKINFDSALRTNVRGRPPPGTYTEATYATASPLLNGQPLTPAQEMGGFCLGSTIVLIFEAPVDFEFTVRTGDKVQVGQKLGDVATKLKLE